MRSKRLLFIPVSSPQGVGEYMRTLQLAHTLKDDYQEGIDIHFILNKHTQYADECPFDTTLLDRSATKETLKVCQFIESFKPDVVVFDCAGRAEQMKAAKKVGAKVVFISQHSKKRAKGIKFNRYNLIDVHWVVQPDFCIQPLSWLEKLKLKLLPLAYPKNVGPFTAALAQSQIKESLAQYNLEKNAFFIVNAGSGGHIVNGINCADVYYEAGLAIAQQTSLKGVVIFGPNYTKPLALNDSIICLSGIQGAAFLALLSQARIAVLSAGDTLLQSISLHTPAIACAISKDQSHRLACCVTTGVVYSAELNVADITDKANELLQAPNYDHVISKYKSLNNVHSFDTITQGVKALLQGEK